MLLSSRIADSAAKVPCSGLFVWKGVDGFELPRDLGMSSHYRYMADAQVVRCSP